MKHRWVTAIHPHVFFRYHVVRHARAVLAYGEILVGHNICGIKPGGFRFDEFGLRTLVQQIQAGGYREGFVTHHQHIVDRVIGHKINAAFVGQVDFFLRPAVQ